MKILIIDIFRTVRDSFPQGFTLAVFLTMAAEYLKNKSLKNYFNSLNNRQSRLYIYLITYAYTVAYRTLLCREATYAPFSKIWQDWGVAPKSDGSGVTIELFPILGNTLMFTVLIILVLMCFWHKLKSEKYILLKCTVLSFLLSMLIELSQAVTCRGTFQISDLVYNTLGGFIGCLIFTKLIHSKKST